MKQAAGRLLRGINVMGGTLVLTPQRLLFTPLIDRSGLQLSNEMADASKDLHDWNLHPQKLLNMAIKPLAKPIVVQLECITTIEPSRRSALTVEWQDALGSRRTEFAVFQTHFSTIWNPRNVTCRDDLLSAINHAREV